MPATRVVHRRWKCLFSNHLPYFKDGFFYLCPKLFCEFHFPPPTGPVMINYTQRNRFPGHLLQTNTLGTELDFIVIKFANRPDFIRPESHRETRPHPPCRSNPNFRPQWQRPLDAYAFLKFTNRLVNPLMKIPSPQCVEVFFKSLLDMNQGTMPRAVTVMLQGGNHDEIVLSPLD